MADAPKTSFNFYEGSIRYAWYMGRHGGWGPKGFIGTIGFFILLIPYGLYYKIAGKQAPDLELL